VTLHDTASHAGYGWPEGGGTPSGGTITLPAPTNRYGQRPDEAAERATIARMVELRAAGRSLREIIATLEAEGRPPPRGDTWYPGTVRRILARELDQT
jgi:hypothetical protein